MAALVQPLLWLAGLCLYSTAAINTTSTIAPTSMASISMASTNMASASMASASMGPASMALNTTVFSTFAASATSSAGPITTPTEPTTTSDEGSGGSGDDIMSSMIEVTSLTSTTLLSSITPTPMASFTVSLSFNNSARTSGPATTTMTPSPPSSTLPTDTPTTTDPPSLAIWAAVGVAGAVLIVLMVIATVLCLCVVHKCCSRDGVKRSTRRKISSSSKKLIECALEEINSDKKSGDEEQVFEHLTAAELISFPPSNLPAYVSKLHDDDSYPADDEYDSVKELDQPVVSTQAQLSCNATRNRYTNILPRDSSRVVLRTIPKVAGSDYINADFIDGFNCRREYIASQGPLPGTCADFWRMVWEYNVSIIVMVTNTEENGTVKCHQYWPSRGTSQYGNTAVTLESQILYPEFVMRELILTSGKSKKSSQVGTTKSVIQYHFTSWPDFGVPKEASAMIKFVRRVRSAVDSSHGPVLTHCSAGVGRTGTYIAVDILTQQIDAGGVVNVQEVVCRMRAQRGHMVQTSAQYLFIYDSLLHYHLFGGMDVGAGSLVEYVGALDTPTPDGSTPLDKEFTHVLDVKLSPDYLFSVALDEANTDKNRDSANIPFDNNRVALQDPSSDSDYINASFITGYYNRIEFIATQAPLHSTVGDSTAGDTQAPLYSNVEDIQDTKSPLQSPVGDTQAPLQSPVGDSTAGDTQAPLYSNVEDIQDTKSPLQSPVGDTQAPLQSPVGDSTAGDTQAPLYSNMGDTQAPLYSNMEDTQAPLHSTVGDFWRMVWEREVRTIVTLGPIKKDEDRYWPSVSSAPVKCEGCLTVTLVETEWVEGAGLLVRELTIRNSEDSDEQRGVTQFHLQSWPLVDVPSDITGIITLIERSRDHWRDTGYNLIAVHTSPGVSGEAGGVYCGLCVLLRQLEVEEAVNVFTTVRRLRKQRPGILTSKVYYRFMYTALESSQKEQ